VSESKEPKSLIERPSINTALTLIGTALIALGLPVIVAIGAVAILVFAIWAGVISGPF
jgi:hypothetical protein